MATNSRTTTSGTPPDMSDIGNQVTSNLASADNIAAQRVQTLMWVHQARAAQMSRTAATLKAHYGPSDPGVKSAEAAVAAANADVARVAVVHQQITTPEPQVAPSGWALHGRVFDAQLQPVSGFTVFLVDATKSYQQAYGFAYTDDTGYFLLKYAGPDSASQDKSQTAAQAATAQLFIGVADRRGRDVDVIVRAFQPVTGTATYQNIVPSEGQPIGEPPPKIRKVAVPKRERKS